jgi:hypothetical protein
MKYILLFVTLLVSCCELCPGQSIYPKTDPARTITTAVDTVVLSGEAYPIYELIITNQSLSDTLQWRTNNDTNWRTLLPSASGFRSILFRMLVREHYRGHVGRLAIDVLDRDLAFPVRPQKIQ